MCCETLPTPSSAVFFHKRRTNEPELLHTGTTPGCGRLSSCFLHWTKILRSLLLPRAAQQTSSRRLHRIQKASLFSGMSRCRRFPHPARPVHSKAVSVLSSLQKSCILKQQASGLKSRLPVSPPVHASCTVCRPFHKKRQSLKAGSSYNNEGNPINLVQNFSEWSISFHFSAPSCTSFLNCTSFFYFTIEYVTFLPVYNILFSMKNLLHRFFFHTFFPGP